jgi:hypothetical protein
VASITPIPGFIINIVVFATRRSRSVNTSPDALGIFSGFVL